MFKVKPLTFAVIAAGLCCTQAHAEDKSRFTLFDPTPAAQMREMSTDRPDTTESPYTVDAGHFQIELSVVEYAHDHSHGVSSDTWSVLPSNVKVGLLNNMDLQFVFAPYINQRFRAAGQTARDAGIGDTLVRLKLNLYGNDGGPVAFGVMPYVKIPTADTDLGNGRVEGGIILPASFQLPAGFEVGTMLEIDIIRNASNSGYGAGLLHTITVGHDIAGELRGYVEYAGTSYIDAGANYSAVIGTGLTCGLGENVQLDGGVNFGLSHSAEDYNLFLGLSFRI